LAVFAPLLDALLTRYFFASGNPQVEDETERELSPKPWRRVLDAPAQIRLFVKLKLVICARPEYRAGFLIRSAIERRLAGHEQATPPAPSA
jgi:hypothetical protein